MILKQQEAEQDNSWYERGELPPVGCVCMCANSENPVEVLRHRINNIGIPVAAVIDTKSSHLFWAQMFRPIKTEREKAIDELNVLVGDIEKYPTWRDAIAAIIDAGYHKN